jgi:hypothetical protein
MLESALNDCAWENPMQLGMDRHDADITEKYSAEEVGRRGTISSTRSKLRFKA